MTQADIAQAEVPLAMAPPSPPSLQGARLRAVVDAEYDGLWRALRRLGVESASVEDAAQQVLLVVARRLDDIPPGSERSFLLGAAVRVASDHRRKQARSREVHDDGAIEEALASTPDAEELLGATRARELLDRALEGLSAELRAVFVLFEFEQMTMAAIADTLGLPRGTVASRLRRAREAFETIAREMHARISERNGA
jgi:RNA polymerase sigma-70 factor (ECF subfamily)